MNSKYSVEHDRRRRELMKQIAYFRTKPISKARDRVIQDLENELDRLGGPIE